MSNWRPDNWEKIVTKDWTENYDEAGRLCFEAGADAMLKALTGEIEKGLLTDEELKMCLQATLEAAPEDAKRDEAKIWAMALRVVAKTQLRKICALLKE